MSSMTFMAEYDQRVAHANAVKLILPTVCHYLDGSSFAAEITSANRARRPGRTPQGERCENLNRDRTKKCKLPKGHKGRCRFDYWNPKYGYSSHKRGHGRIA